MYEKQELRDHLNCTNTFFEMEACIARRNGGGDALAEGVHKWYWEPNKDWRWRLESSRQWRSHGVTNKIMIKMSVRTKEGKNRFPFWPFITCGAPI
jgi:hypothetical protein